MLGRSCYLLIVNCETNRGSLGLASLCNAICAINVITASTRRAAIGEGPSAMDAGKREARRQSKVRQVIQP